MVESPEIDVLVKFSGILSQIAGTDAKTVTAARGITVEELLDRVLASLPARLRESLVASDTGRLTYCHLVVNGRSHSPAVGLKERLMEDSEITLVPPLAGG